MPVRDVIVAKLSEKFAPTHLEVIDESARHAGHSGARPEGETHFRIRIAARALDGLSRLARHRAINEVLADELASGVHALAIEVTPTGSPQA
ncbi:MAG TPA: BolA family protein [Devosia sp.]|nr:BolA family protein [Devosia sp.]